VTDEPCELRQGNLGGQCPICPPHLSAKHHPKNSDRKKENVFLVDVWSLTTSKAEMAAVQLAEMQWVRHTNTSSSVFLSKMCLTGLEEEEVLWGEEDCFQPPQLFSFPNLSQNATISSSHTLFHYRQSINIAAWVSARDKHDEKQAHLYGFVKLFTTCCPPRGGKTLYLNSSFSETQHSESNLCSPTRDDPVPWLSHHEEHALPSAFPVPADTQCSHQWTINT